MSKAETFSRDRYPKVERVPGEWFQNQKSHPMRLQLNSLSPGARQVYSNLELHTENFDSEVALVMVGNSKYRLLTTNDIAHETGLSERNVRRYLEELHEHRMASREAIDGGRLRKARIEIHCFLNPPLPQEQENVIGDTNKAAARRRNSDPPASPWELLSTFANRLKRALPPEIEAARSLNSELFARCEAAARGLENAEKEARAVVDEVCALSKNARSNKEVRPVRPVRPVEAGESSAPEGFEPGHLYQGNGSSSSSGLSVVPKTTTIDHPDISSPPPPPAPDEAFVVQATMNEYTDSDLDAASDLLRDCRNHAPAATVTDVCQRIRAKGGIARRATNPTGFLLTAVPKLFKGWRSAEPEAPSCPRCRGTGNDALFPQDDCRECGGTGLPTAAPVAGSG